MLRVGQGFDVHAFAGDRRLVLGGIEIPWPVGLAGHSDADVLVHAIIDSLFGAAGLGDIGHHFPDSEAKFMNADSLDLLSSTMQMIAGQGWGVINVDATIIAQEPKLAPYISGMVEKIAPLLGVSGSCLNIKATTSERLGFTGRGEGIACMAIALIESEESPVVG